MVQIAPPRGTSPNRIPRAAGPQRTRQSDEPLWRKVLGAQLRELRHQRGQRLTDVATRAGVSPQYLSEIERGLKEPSSEMIAAIVGALGTRLVDLTAAVSRALTAADGRATQLGRHQRSGDLGSRGRVLAIAA